MFNTKRTKGNFFIVAILSKCNSLSGYSVFILQRINLDIQVGEHTNEASLDGAKDTMNDVQKLVHHLIGQMQYINKQQDYQRVCQQVFKCKGVLASFFLLPFLV